MTKLRWIILYIFASIIALYCPSAFGANFNSRNQSTQVTLAAKFPQYLRVEVTGKPAIASTVRGAVIRALQTEFKVQPGGTISYTLPSIPVLYAGGKVTVQAMVTANASNCSQAYGPVNVEVKNDNFTFSTEKELWFDNSPEDLTSPTALYANRLQAGESIRLLYHHVCFNTMPMYLTGSVINDSNIPAQIIIISGDAKPDKNPALAGLLAAKEYLPARIRQSGDILVIPPHAKLPFALRRMVMGQVMSGLCSIELLAGGPKSVLVRTDCGYFIKDDLQTETALMFSRPWNYIVPQPFKETEKSSLAPNSTAYLNPLDEDEKEITIGNAGYQVKIGVEGIPKVGGGRHLNGNFGVLYNRRIAINNPTLVPVKFDLYFRCTEPYSGAMFVVDGRSTVVRPLHSGEVRLLASYIIKGQSSRTINWSAIPCSGNSYPDEVFANITRIISEKPLPPVAPLTPLKNGGTGKHR